MNDYDDSEDYSSGNSFRARSNTWPLNRPDLAVPNSVCIDEALPEIELEEDDLFTTNENWSTGLVDHDIMSWDPILNAQNQHHQHNHHHHHHHQQQNNHQAQPHNQLQQAATVHHHHHPHQTHPRQLPIHHNQQQSQQQQQQQQPHQLHEQNLISGSTIILDGSQVQQQQPQQLPPQHHQTLNNQHCLTDPDEFHLQQLHHLRLDNNPQAQTDHQAHYIPPLSSTLCIQGPASLGLCNDSYNVSSDHHQQQQHHHLQPLTPARYDLDQQNDLELSTQNVHHHINHQLHPLTSTSSLEQQSTSHMLSSSLATSGIGLSGDLEDLDYKAVDPSLILQNSSYDEQQGDQPSQGDGIGGKSSGSATSSKTKLNTPRKNAWGNMSYADLISQAINSTNDKRLTLSQIYDWMVQHVPYFKDKGDSNSSAGWKNSVRHNLSLHNRFKRLQNEGTGKSSWWTINPEANVGKCARRRAASMEASKYEKKRGRAKKRAEAIRQGLISYPSLTNSSLNGSAGNLDQHANLNQTSVQFGPQPQQQAQPTQQTNQQPQPAQQIHQQPLPNTDGQSSDNLHNNDNVHPNAGLYLTSTQNSQYDQIDNKLQQQQERYFYFNHHQIEPPKHNIDYVL